MFVLQFCMVVTKQDGGAGNRGFPHRPFSELLSILIIVDITGPDPDEEVCLCSLQ